MRLPQSIIRPLSVFYLHFLITGMLLVFCSGALHAFSTVPELARSPSLLRFGNVDVGQTETLMVTLTNGGQSNVTVSEVSISDAAFATPNLTLPLVVPAGQSVEVSISFTPATTGWTPGLIKFLSTATNSSLSVQAGGTGVDSEAVTVKPSSLSFGQVPLGGTSSLPLILTNARTWNITISGIQITGAGFSISGPTFPVTLSRGQSLALSVNYAPQSAGLAGGSMLVSGPGLCVPLTGTGTTSGMGQLSISPASLNYSTVPVGTTDTLPITVSATGASVTVSSPSSSSSQFVLTGASFPVTIASGQSMSFNVAFTPQSSGTLSGSLLFSSTASNSPATEPLTGVGTQTAYTVGLSWNPSSAAVGYNVYRSSSSTGSYSKINPALDNNTAYTDSTVTAGTTYYYAATSVNSSGIESSLSTPVQVAVP
ncbi:MAG: choice-of-anchor D domain-containing protein [Candidatus Sulfotelmatobacter sp.]